MQSCIAQNFSSQTINGDGIRPRISVHPHEWGVFFKNDGPQSIGGTGMLEFEAEHKGTFTRIICADCLWMKDQHGALVRSLLWFLKPSSHSERNGEDGGIAWVVAGFHSGREIVASFFDTAVSMGMVVKDIYERDVNATVEMGEVRREWKPVREGEGPENRARWCVVAVLKKRGC